MVTERDVVVSVHHYSLGHSCHTSSFIIQNKQFGIYKKRGIECGDLQFIYKRGGTKFPCTKHLVHKTMKYKYTIYTMCGKLA